jgi:hypothetical protein
MIAAEVLGRRRERSAVPSLRSLAIGFSDPYLAAQALESLVEIEGADASRDLLLELASSGPVQVRRVARSVLDRPVLTGHSRE